MNKFFLLLLLSFNIYAADSETTDLKQNLAELIKNFNKEKCEGLSVDEIIKKLEQLIKNGKN
jgi:hypothetical protein